MSPSRQDLLEFLQKIDRLVPEEIAMTLVGAGDTAMALLDMKPPTTHLDFAGNDKDISDFIRISAAVPAQGFQLHTWTNGLLFGHQLPDDYLKSSLQVDAGLEKIGLRALNPLDIVVTRIERLSDSDMSDIKACIKKFRLGKNQISKRARALQRVGNESRFERNLEYVLGLYA